MGLFKRAHQGEIEIEKVSDLPPDAFELARLWVNSERSFVAVGRPREWQPELLGSLTMECLRTAAEAYAATTGLSETEALERMCLGFDEERERLKNGQ